jgi:hypothetical protein
MVATRNGYPAAFKARVTLQAAKQTRTPAELLKAPTTAPDQLVEGALGRRRTVVGRQRNAHANNSLAGNGERGTVLENRKVAMGFTPSDLISLVSLLVALVALLISIQNLRIADRAARNDVLAQVRDWGGEVIDMLSEAEGLCRLDPKRLSEGELFLRRSALISRASALWDRGRCFFPNTYRELHGTNTSEAFRGFRPQILDLLALSHGLAANIDSITGTGRDRRGLAFVRVKREFVSTIQNATSFSAPKSVKAYEVHLSKIPVEPLPYEIRVLANAVDRGFQLTFDASLALEPVRPEKGEASP